MPPFDYTTAPPPREFELIPGPTVATVQMRIRRGGAGEDGLLKRSKDGRCEMLDPRFVVVDGPYAHRKFWQNFVLEGTSPGHAVAAEISRGILRAIIESARGIMPDDVSPEARAARTVALKDFDNLIFIAKIGIEKGGPKKDGGNYPDKNVLVGVVTPDKKKDWHPVEQPAPNGGEGGSTAAAAPVAPAATTAPAAPAPGIAKPSWAT